MPENNIGRLVRTSPEVCSWCGKAHLQVRGIMIKVIVEGEDLEEEKLFLRCPKCENEEEYIDKKKDNKKKHRELKRVEEAKEVKNYGRHKERPTAKRNFNSDSKRSY